MSRYSIFLPFVGISLLVATISFFLFNYNIDNVGYAQRSEPVTRVAPVPQQSVANTNAPIPAGTVNPLLAERWSELLPEERVSAMVYENCHPSVVNIDTRSTRTNFLFGDIDIPGGGSGIVLDKLGHILTNFHVVEDATGVEVTLSNGKSYPARKIGTDPATDIAVLKIDAPKDELFPVVFGDSTRLLVGQKIYAIGNPFGLESTLTSGIISSLNRSISSRSRYRPIRGVIQIDAAINPGNSGGPLLDTQGRMIGINTAIASRVEQSSGVGFAIPSNTIQRIVPQIMKTGKVVRGECGIEKVMETDDGLRILTMTPDGAAERAGLRGPKIVRYRDKRGAMVVEGTRIDPSFADVIVSVNGKPSLKAEDFLALVEEQNPGETVTITIIREERKMEVKLTLD
ncbi:MAG: trypsin-like peptidase domain-containing protein [Planctomycetaceae bacterium]|jgi:S1-C subfamily serine protease|nr:trypsin-like peptidase domain-containing protein [Planctomycetaceae bacterium]